MLSLNFSALSQEDSLLLKLSSNYKDSDSAKGYTIRMDLISHKTNSILLPVNPTFPSICCEKDQKVGFIIEKLEGNCFIQYKKCASCSPLMDPSEPNKIQDRSQITHLKFGDTLSYSEEIGIFEIKFKARKAIAFTGEYRVRGWRYYNDAGEERRLESDWFYITFPN